MVNKIRYPDPLHAPLTSRILILSLIGFNTKETIKTKLSTSGYSEGVISDGIQALVRENYLLCLPQGENKKKFYYPPNREKIKEDLLGRQAKFLTPSFYLGKEKAPQCHALMQEALKKKKEISLLYNKRKLHHNEYRKQIINWYFDWQQKHHKAFLEELEQYYKGTKDQKQKDKIFLQLVREHTPKEILQIIEKYLTSLKEIPESKQFPAKSFFVDFLPLINNFEIIYSMFFNFLNKNKDELLKEHKNNEKLNEYITALMINNANTEQEQALASLIAIEPKPDKKVKEFIDKMEEAITQHLILEKYKNTMLNLHNRNANKKYRNINLKNKLKQQKLNEIEFQRTQELFKQ